ncbi:uncharacterized protein LOC131435460 [Malaya genurostris]|uniref:uncharacterized protein LOC131434937 n=1 Tax=Malaya genurostris TaxID=325434 RepID=UPI0026F3921F|nr:uncharacterized protein LOC131434937 [Malaya genurostris]XP_058458235.1 uncharacterized protein LOC131434937 [Malaya genurostris]XP_058458246.1 uncharacterized protein LOC131434937 [Malaya genurostris]XP_058458257.1 uncharacterized protein LOC131434937 [Malaya genurostris]XP_058459352.1 uncharacterized protein LOC131435460 [Malaya genurostris]XP_058459361.1 uncharacterized protein LOC131435460 [Malaya genurostris]XP_058459367.1 uncharacterized protein LOC131435460 [Malaya genurostris]XP_0
MSLKTRGIVFATFFGSCLIVGLLVAALTTDNWVQSNAKRNSTESQGRIHFGLFGGQKHLNVAYGWRVHEINVLDVLRDEPDVMSYWLWFGTTIGTGLGALSGAVGAVASVLKSSSASKKTGTMLILFVSNFLSGLSQLLSFVCWLIQFYQYLTHNVLLEDDRKNNWSSQGLASLGTSFYFVVAGILVVIINIILLTVAVKMERRERNRVLEPLTDEKNQGAIMLY